MAATAPTDGTPPSRAQGPGSASSSEEATSEKMPPPPDAQAAGEAATRDASSNAAGPLRSSLGPEGKESTNPEQGAENPEQGAATRTAATPSGLSEGEDSANPEQSAATRTAVTPEQEEDSIPLGEYRYVGGEAQRQEMNASIEAVTGTMSRLVRGIASRRLKASNEIPKKVSVRQDGDMVIVSIDENVYRAALGGPPVRVENSEGGTSRMQLHLRQGRLYQSFRADEGQRINVFAPYADGDRINLWVTVRSDRLPAPVKYHLTYARSS